MAFTIDTFRNSALAKGGARANLFDVTISGVGATDASRVCTVGVAEFVFACKAAAIPAQTIGVVEVPYFGRVVKVPGNKTFDNWTVTIINDEGFTIRSGMEKWVAAMGTHVGNINTTTNANLYGNGTVKQYPKTGGTVALAQYNFVNIFPINVSEITLGWDANDAIEEYTVEFAYDYWTHTGQVTA